MVGINVVHVIDCCVLYIYSLQVLDVKAKIDRNTMEHIRNLPSPPTLIGEVMEMVQDILKSQPPHTSHPGARGAQQDAIPMSAESGRAFTGAAMLAFQKRRQTGTVMSKKLDRDRWTAIQTGIGDPQRYVDALFAIPWEDSLPVAKLELLESRLAPQPLEASEIAAMRKISSQTPPRRQATQSMLTRHTSLLQASDSQDTPHEVTFITVSKARYASEDVAMLTSYLLEIMHYQHALKPCLVARQELRALEQKLIDLDSRQEDDLGLNGEIRPSSPIAPGHRGLKLTDEELRVLEKEVQRVQQKYDQAVMRKHELESRLGEISGALQTGSSLLSW